MEFAQECFNVFITIHTNPHTYICKRFIFSPSNPSKCRTSFNDKRTINSFRKQFHSHHLGYVAKVSLIRILVHREITYRTWPKLRPVSSESNKRKMDPAKTSLHELPSF